MKLSGSAWDDEEKETTRKLWKEGLSASQIAKKLNGARAGRPVRSRNSVIGILHRMGECGRITPARPARVLQRAPRARTQVHEKRVSSAPRTNPAPFVAREVPLTPLALADGSFATALTVTDAMCKYPIGDPSEASFAFCGRAATHGHYCDGHHQVVSIPAPQSRKRHAQAVRETQIKRTFDAFEHGGYWRR